MDISMEVMGYVLSNAVIIGIVWGVYKNKVDSLKQDHTTLVSDTEKKVKDLETRLKEEVTAIEEAFDESIKELGNTIKDITKELNTIDRRCATRESYTHTLPQLVEDFNKLKIEVSSLPSKLSSEIAKSFSEEYQRIISNIVTRGSKSSDK